MFGVTADILILTGDNAGKVSSFLTTHKTIGEANESLNWLNENIEYAAPVAGAGFQYEFLTLPVIVTGADYDIARKFHLGN